MKFVYFFIVCLHIHPHTLTSAGQTRSTSLSFGVTFAIVITVIVFVMVVIIIISYAIYTRVRAGRMRNNRRGAAAANPNFPATILSANTLSPNFVYAPLPHELPPSCPDCPTSIDNTDFGGQPQQLHAQQPVSSHEYTQKYPIQQVPYGAPSYPQPTAVSEGATPTAPQLHPESNN